MKSAKTGRGAPLDSFETVRKFIRTTSTTTGLEVKAYIDSKNYKKGVKINVEQMSQLNIRKHDELPNWNYTITPS